MFLAVIDYYIIIMYGVILPDNPAIFMIWIFVDKF